MQQLECIRMYWQIPQLAFDKTTPWATQDDKDVESDSQHKEQAKPRASLCCAYCRHPVTEPEAMLEIHGQHFHVYANPEGVTFEIRLFHTAACIRQGPATYAYTWFSGYAWQVALCGNCQRQLGWVYSRDAADYFYGLIADRLVQTYS